MGTPIEQLQAIRRIRDYAVALSLAPDPLPTSKAEQAIVERQAAERESLKHASVAAKEVLTRRVERLESDGAELESSVGGSEPHDTLADLRQRRETVVAELAVVHDQIRRLRHEHEDKLADEELRRLDDEESQLLDRVSRDRLTRHQLRLEAWRGTMPHQDAHRQRLGALRDRLDSELQKAKEQLARVREPFVSRTVAGFLLWAGYSAVAATGAAVAYLLTPNRGEQDAFGAIVQSMMTVAGAMRSALPGWLLLPVSVLVLALLLGSVALAFFGCDKLIHYFDKSWRRRERRERGFSRTTLGLPSPEISRRAYIQALALLPFAYLAGLVFIIVTYRGGTAQSMANVAAVAPAVLHTAIGSVVTLLTAAVFVLYAIKVLERRMAAGDAAGVRRSWEIVIPPLLVVAAFAVAMFRPQPDRYVWGGVALYMVISSIGLAYGVVYRGLFRDVDELDRLLRACDTDIEQLDAEPELDEPERAERHEARQIRSGYLRRRQQLLDQARRRRANRREARPEGTTHVSLVSRIFGSGSAPQSNPSDWRIIDADAAPDQARRRGELQNELTQLEQQIADLAARTAQDELRARLAASRSEHRDAKADLATFDERAASELARLLERQVLEIEEFRRAYAIGQAVRPALEVFRDRSRKTAEQATRYWRQPEA